MTATRLVLASTSPFRRELLARLGMPFSVADPATDETPLPAETPEATALRLSEAKARAVAAQHPDALIIGSATRASASTIGSSEKPGNHANAVAQPAGDARTHRQISSRGLCLLNAGSGQAHLRGVPTRITVGGTAKEEEWSF